MGLLPIMAHKTGIIGARSGKSCLQIGQANDATRHHRFPIEPVKNAAMRGATTADRFE